MRMKTDSLYIHIPFCIRKCLYCDFFSVPYDEKSAKKYIDAVCKELSLKKCSAITLKTVYIGGGTPSLLPAGCFEKLFTCLTDSFMLSPSAEITVEVNPQTIDDAKINTLISLGVNRLSVGIQSFNNDELKTLGRIHTAEDALRIIGGIRNAGLHNYSIDLMYGIPGQTMESWQKSLSRAVSLYPTHISAYELTPEENTSLYGLIKSQKIRMPDENLVIEMYNHLIDYLSRHGYKHYEISNFALPGFECIHNLNYWDRGEFIGVGAGAHSFIGMIRSKNTDDITRYEKNLDIGILPEGESTDIGSRESLEESFFLGLRKTEGIPAAPSENLGLHILDICRDLVDDGYLEIEGGYLRFTRTGIVLSNALIVKLFERLQPIKPPPTRCK
jgi:oxygen-independent coproporphyrinogen-3 oxidase